jgi:hypothetical protein
MFPHLKKALISGPRTLPVLLSIFGPAPNRPPDEKTRMLYAASRHQRTWHLTGECIPDPPLDRTRYHNLTSGDFGLFSVREADFQPLPKHITLLLISRKEDYDCFSVNELDKIIGKRTMAILSVEELSKLGALPWSLTTNATTLKP